LYAFIFKLLGPEQPLKLQINQGFFDWIEGLLGVRGAVVGTELLNALSRLVSLPSFLSGGTNKSSLSVMFDCLGSFLYLLGPGSETH
jgi:hypothetical protein